MTQNEIRKYLGGNDAVVIQIANSEDGSPEVAWGDTFFYVRDKSGDQKKMPFATIVTKDYVGFDSDSKLNRGGLYRINIEVGKEKFEELFGFKPNELENNRSKFDFTLVNQFFPHPLYGENGWVSIINPEKESIVMVKSLLDFSLERS
ncbi:MAG: erythromycin esterase [Cyanobacteria bacterium CRU_2_1]|nr:erythromycin esterase [Cyanobacteria bacterium CRU_2_1]